MVVEVASPVKAARWQPIAAPKCQVCDKSVYEQEKLMTDGKTFHKTCFRCLQCKKVLSLGSYASLNEKTYCKPHFKQLFAEKGNYGDSFGMADPKKEWGGGGGDNEGGANTTSSSGAAGGGGGVKAGDGGCPFVHFITHAHV